MTENAQGIVMFIAVGVVVFAVTALVGPLWLATALTAGAAGVTAFAVAHATRRD